MAALVQALAGGVDAEGHQVVVDPHLELHRGVLVDLGPQLFVDRALDALGGRAGVVDLRGLGAHLDAHRNVRAQHRPPVELARALVELGEVEGAKFADPRQHAGCATQGEVGAPDLGPIAGEGYAAGRGAGHLEARRARLVGKHGFQPRGHDEENLE